MPLAGGDEQDSGFCPCPTARCSLVVSPPCERTTVVVGLGVDDPRSFPLEIPLLRAPTACWWARDGGVDAYVPRDQALCVGLCLQLLEDSCPGAVALPPPEQVVGPVPRPIALREITPRRVGPGPGPPPYPVDQLPRVQVRGRPGFLPTGSHGSSRSTGRSSDHHVPRTVIIYGLDPLSQQTPAPLSVTRTHRHPRPGRRPARAGRPRQPVPPGPPHRAQRSRRSCSASAGRSPAGRAAVARSTTRTCARAATSCRSRTGRVSRCAARGSTPSSRGCAAGSSGASPRPERCGAQAAARPGAGTDATATPLGPGSAVNSPQAAAGSPRTSLASAGRGERKRPVDTGQAPTHRTKTPIAAKAASSSASPPAQPSHAPAQTTDSPTTANSAPSAHRTQRTAPAWIVGPGTGPLRNQRGLSPSNEAVQDRLHAVITRDTSRSFHGS